MIKSLKRKDLVTILELSLEELNHILETAAMLKMQSKINQPHPLLTGKTLAMIFQKPSLRTRVSFEVGMNQMGGNAIFLASADIDMGKRETIEDTAKVLSRYVDGIMARVYGHEIIEELARHADVPVINGLSDFSHPCQILGDLLTMMEKKEFLKGLKVAFVGAGNNVAHSLMFAAAKVGFNLNIVCPEGYDPKDHAIEAAAKESRASGAEIHVVHVPQQGVENCDVIYTDVWASMGEESEREERARIFKEFQVNRELMEYAKSDAVVMHCLPAHYGEEITQDIGHDPRAVFVDQAENRLHAQKAVMALLMS